MSKLYQINNTYLKKPHIEKRKKTALLLSCSVSNKKTIYGNSKLTDCMLKVKRT